MLTAATIVAILRDTIEPLNGCYRAAARLDDGRFLPCVTFVDVARWRSQVARLAGSVRKEDSDGVAAPFTVTLGSDAIAEVHPSPFAWPAALIRALSDPAERQECSRFTLVMNDGHCVHYDVADPTDFLGIPHYLPPPPGYTFADVRSLSLRPEPAAALEIIRYGYDGNVVCPVEGLGCA